MVGDGNALALRLYHAAGFEEVSREAVHPDDADAPGAFWLLLSKAIQPDTRADPFAPILTKQ